MHPYLQRLGVRVEIQEWFAPYVVKGATDLLFQQGTYREAFGLAFHRVDANDDCWLTNETDEPFAERVLIAGSVMDLIGFLHYHGHMIACRDRLLLLATGPNPAKAAINKLGGLLKEKAITLLYPADLLGAIADLKVASALRGMPAAALLAEKEKLQIFFRAKVYEFEQQGFSLSVFERAAKYRFNVTTHKPKHGASFLEQLRAGAFPPP